MPGRIQLVAVLAALVLLLAVFEMVRRRRLMERYALLWMFSASVLTVLAAWRGGMKLISHALGIIYPPNALFFVALGFILFLLLHFSAAVSRLSDQTKVLAQRSALLEERLRRLEGAAPASVETEGIVSDATGNGAHARDSEESRSLTGARTD